MKKLILMSVLMFGASAQADMVSVSVNVMDMSGTMRGQSCILNTDKKTQKFKSALGDTKFVIHVEADSDGEVRVSYKGKKANEAVDLVQVSPIATPYSTLVGLTTATVGYAEVSVGQKSDYSPELQEQLGDYFESKVPCKDGIFGSL